MMLQPFNRRIRRRLLQGEIGQVLWAIAGTAPWTYHLNEEFRTGEDVLTQVDPTWYFRKPGGGPLYDTTVYPLHTLTGLLGPARRVAALSGLALRQREFRGKAIEADMDDSTFLLLDFGESLFAVVYGTLLGGVVKGFHPTIFGTAGSVVGSAVNGEEMRQDGDHQPHVVGEHAGLRESHVFEDLMQLVDWVRDGVPSIASAEHARHVIDIFESAYRAAATGRTQDLATTFEPLPLDAC
jgi:predicted dehydrogenase